MEKPGKIYLADQRGLIENSSIRRYCTFNFESYFNEHRTAFENLFICNDDSIAAGKLNFYLAKQNSLHLFIPITGGIDIVAKNKEFSVETGQVQLLSLEKGEVLEISNPYQNDVVNYIHLGMLNDDFIFFKDQQFSFDFDKNPNKLIDIISGYKFPFKLSAGIFAGREAVIYNLLEKDNFFYAFVVDGAFEIEGRLMHGRDGLALWATENIEIEALSNNAIVVTLELFPLI
ncbi:MULTISPECIES: hypothetical protein [unclassified Pedobacter]|uniref:pirin family protein n=1 Tax=unclassified Pedobacter TaxID=2628915 RepID=UPI001E410932|nr:MULTISPECIES: hypothetical protein [unclassified Pedobacter]